MIQRWSTVARAGFRYERAGLPFVAAQYSPSSRICREFSVVALVYNHADEEKLEVIVVVFAFISA